MTKGSLLVLNWYPGNGITLHRLDVLVFMCTQMTRQGRTCCIVRLYSCSSNTSPHPPDYDMLLHHPNHNSNGDNVSHSRQRQLDFGKWDKMMCQGHGGNVPAFELTIAF